MIMDKQNLFSDAQAVTATAGSTNVMDLGIAGRNIGVGEQLYLVCIVDVTLDDTGDDSTITVTLETDDNESMSSPATIMTLGTFAANAAAGSRLVAPLPVTDSYQRYLGVRYTAANGNLSAGAFTSFLTKDIDAYKSYADNRTYTT